MKQSIFDLVSEQTDCIIKEALLVPALRTLGGAAIRGIGWAAKNPMKTVGAALTGADLAGGTKRFMNVTNKNVSNPFTRTV